MIREIVNFVEYLEEKSPEIFSENINLKEGVYVFLEKEGDEFIIKKDNVLKVGKDTEKNNLYRKFLELRLNTGMLNAMKSFNSGPKIYIEIGSPFAISIPYKAILEKGINKRLEAAEAYFKAAEKYINSENAQHIKWEKEFKNFILTKAFDIIDKEEIFQKLTKKDTIYFFLKKPSFDDYKENHERFLSEKLFNKDKFNITTAQGETYGISDILSGFNEKKEFLKHKTAPIELNYRVNGKDATKLYKFFQLQKNGILPNPMPVFVDRNELTQETIKFYKEDRKRGHKEIIEHLLKEKTPDLQNYYLIFFQNNLKGSRIIDLDFVPVFRYKTDNMPEVRAVFNIRNRDNENLVHDFTIKNIFEFQDKILNFVFNKQLISETKNGLWIKYFDDLEVDTKFNMATETIVNLFYKYRRAFYDYVYKSRRQAITGTMFYDIMSNSVLDDIKRDKDYNKTFSIKEKLNIWFSFYNYFNNNKKPEDMVNKTEQLFERLKQIAQNDNERIRSDEEFAFAAGQLIRTILNKSEAGERSHALLEPFLQKTNPGQFKLAIAREFEKYKHAFKFYKGDKNRYEFDKIMSEVMGVETNTNIKTFLPLILAGYFSETIFKKDEEQN